MNKGTIVGHAAKDAVIVKCNNHNCKTMSKYKCTHLRYLNTKYARPGRFPGSGQKEKPATVMKIPFRI